MRAGGERCMPCYFICKARHAHCSLQRTESNNFPCCHHFSCRTSPSGSPCSPCLRAWLIERWAARTPYKSASQHCWRRRGATKCTQVGTVLVVLACCGRHAVTGGHAPWGTAWLWMHVEAPLLQRHGGPPPPIDCI